jgi:hypothetical protein
MQVGLFLEQLSLFFQAFVAIFLLVLSMFVLILLTIARSRFRSLDFDGLFSVDC